MSHDIVQLKGKTHDAVSGDSSHRVAETSADTAVSIPVKVRATPQPAHISANHIKPHAAQSSTTLMRRAVKKPSQGIKRQLHVQSELAHPAVRTISVKHSATHIDTTRLAKAQQIPKHQQVDRFHVRQSGVPIVFASIPVQQAPENIPTNDPPVVPPPAPTNRPDDIFERAIDNATHFVDITAHKAHFKKKARRHALSMASGALALLLVAGFAAYQNTPGLQLKVAGLQAGITTATPNFSATGFAYNGATASQSRLVIGLKSGNSTYQLSEQKTNWSGDEMVAQVSAVDASGQTNYNTLDAAGHTVYRFGTTQATWVKDGIWYQVNGTRGLTDAQLKSLVQNT